MLFHWFFCFWFFFVYFLCVISGLFKHRYRRMCQYVHNGLFDVQSHLAACFTCLPTRHPHTHTHVMIRSSSVSIYSVEPVAVDESAINLFDYNHTICFFFFLRFSSNSNGTERKSITKLCVCAMRYEICHTVNFYPILHEHSLCLFRNLNY